MLKEQALNSDTGIKFTYKKKGGGEVLGKVMSVMQKFFV
jgi:hypothetical protein